MNILVDQQYSRNTSNLQKIQTKSIGIGDKQLYLHRDIIQWKGIFLQGKYMIADPQSINKLLTIQAQIEFQKRIAENKQQYITQKAQSFHSYFNKIKQVDLSYATEINFQKQKLDQIKIIQELQREQQLYAKRIIEVKNKKKQQKKKGVKNLVKINLNKQQNKSVNMNIPIKQDIIIQDCKKSMINKEIKFNLEDKCQKQYLNIHNIEINNNLNNKQQKTIQNKQIQMKQQIIINNIQSRKQNNIINIQQSKLIQSIKLNNYNQNNIMHHNITPNHHLKISQILSIKSQQKQIIIQNTNNRQQQRAGDAFFYNLHSQIDRIELSNQPIKLQQKKKSIIKYQQPIIQKKPFKYQPSSTMINTKQLLKKLNDDLRQIGMIQPQQDSYLTSQKLDESKLKIPKPQQNIILHSKLIQPQENPDQNNNNKQTIKQKIKQIQQVKQIKPQRKMKLQQIINLNIQPIKIKQQMNNKIDKKRQNCKLISTLFNHQIVQVAPKMQSDINKIQKQKLNQEISILKQVIDQLRVERLKYQTNQKSNYTNYYPIIRQGQSQEQYHSHRVIISNLNNISQSAVSQIRSVNYRSNVAKKSIPGKIAKNMSPAKIHQTEEQFSNSIKVKEIKEDIHETQHQRSEVNKVSQKQSQSRQVFNIQQTKSVKIKSQEVSQSNNPQEESNKTNNFSSNTPEPEYNFTKTKKNLPNVQQSQIANSSVRPQLDMESSMPRPLNKHNHSQQPKFIIQQHENHQKRHDSNIKKRLKSNFDQLQVDNKKKITIINEQQKQPKKRASREGVLKTIQSKAAVYHPDLNKIILNNQQNNLKSKIAQIQQSRNQKSYSNNVLGANRNNINNSDSKSSKGFRLRRQSQASRQSKASSAKRQTKSRQKNTNLKIHSPIKLYVPIPSQNVTQTVPQPFSQQKIEQFQQQPQDIKHITFKVSQRNIIINQIQIPQFPDPPNSTIKIQQMAQLIKKLNIIMKLQLKQADLLRIIMKKYKNCIMLDLPNTQNLKLIWHYNGKVYIGQWDQSTMLKIGQGIEFVPQKYYYKGQFSNGKRQGFGIIVQQSGNIYQGQWLQGQKNGIGKWIDKSIKLSYQGQWKNGKRDGYGYLKIENQSIYEGKFLQNYKDGHGTELFFNGDSYKGQYSKGRFQGKGIYVWASGDSYQGQFKEGCKHGKGIWKSFIGQKYDGLYKLDKKCGYGKYTWANGCYYEGQFDEDKKNGQGILHYPDRRETRGIWKDGKLIEPFETRKDDKEEPLNIKKSKVIQPNFLSKVIDSKLQSSSAKK